MTIASEITRLQGAKTDIRTAIQNKGVSVPDSAKLDTYSLYIDQIETGIGGIEVFLPATITVQYAIDNENAAPSMSDYIFDTFSPNEDVYYQYFWYRDDTSTAYQSFKVGILTKTFATNPGFVQGLTVENIREQNYITRIVDRRMKKTGNNVVVSVLYTMEYDNNRQEPSGRSKRYTCVNMTNGTGESVTLGTIYGDDSGAYSPEDISSMYQARETSCGLTENDVLPSLNLTSLSFSRTTSGSSYYNLNANINYPS